MYKAEIHEPYILLRRLNLTLLLQNQAESTNSLYDLQLLLRWYILLKTYNNNVPEGTQQCLLLTAILSQSESTLLILGTLSLKVFNSMYGVSEKKQMKEKKQKRNDKEGTGEKFQCESCLTDTFENCRRRPF